MSEGVGERRREEGYSHTTEERNRACSMESVTTKIDESNRNTSRNIAEAEGETTIGEVIRTPLTPALAITNASDNLAVHTPITAEEDWS